MEWVNTSTENKKLCANIISNKDKLKIYLIKYHVEWVNTSTENKMGVKMDNASSKIKGVSG